MNPHSQREVSGVLAEVGPRWREDIAKYRQIVLKTYAPLLSQSPTSGVTVTRDWEYGPNPRHRIDAFRPDGALAAPVIVFVHGGAFIRGSKSTSEGIYDNVLYWFARNGCVGFNVEYRLAPEARFPAGADDVGNAFSWVAKRCAEFNGDPESIFLVGHSAGATHIASYLTDPAVTRRSAHRPAGVALISGRLRVDALPQNPNANGVRAYFGDDPSQYEARSPVGHAHRMQHPLLVAIAQYENPLLDVYGAEYAWRVAQERGTAPRFVQVRGHNHSSMMMHFNTGDEILGREILSFVSENARNPIAEGR
jgi:acetyl esterase/lipase